MEDRKVLRGGNAGAKALRQEPPSRTEERLTKAGVAGAGRGSSAGEEVGRTQGGTPRGLKGGVCIGFRR